MESHPDRKPFLQGQVALVTGSARRSGSAMVRALAAAGATVVVNGRRSHEAAEALTRELQQAHGAQRALTCMADASNEAEVAAMMQKIIDRCGRLDILVNNAVLRKHGPLQDFSLADWHAVMSSSLDAAFLCAKHAAPHLARAGAGRIINLGGAASQVPARCGAAVSAAKAGIEGLTRALALELGAQRITVNCISPGVMLTDGDPPQRAIDLRDYCDPEKLPIARFGRVDETVGVLLALCSPAFAYMTGQVIHVNGGLHYGG